MPRTSQIVPEHAYPHQMVVINDNTEVSTTLASDSGTTRMLFVFASPKGRDNQIITISNGLAGFVNEYGNGPFSLYGQPYLNAYNAAASGAATLQCLRVSDTNAKYAAINIVAQYLVDENKKMNVRFVAQPMATALSDLANIDSYTPAATVTVDTKEYTQVKLFTVAYRGRCEFGNNMRFRISNYSTGDKENNYKNYLFEVYVNENGLTKKEEFQLCFNEDAIYSGVSLFADGIINNPDGGSDILRLSSNMAGFEQILKAYNTANTTSNYTMDTFDALLGIDKSTQSSIANYVIDTTSTGVVALNSLSGIALASGDDGAFAATTDAAARKTAMDAAYLAAYSGTTVPEIKSKNKYPCSIILDANFEAATKLAIGALAVGRGDCVAILDCGLGITTKASVKPYVTTNLATNITNRCQSIEAYAGKIKDPYNGKIVTVTGTYWLAAAYPQNFANNGAKHIPLAGNNYGVMTGFIPNTIYPVFDEDIDSTIMDELVDLHVNFARINANQNVIRATQTTAQTKATNLSELSNEFILLDIKRDCEKLCTRFEFNFSEASDIARFNTLASNLLNSYAYAQVRSIAAHFDKNAWEAERGILHMYVEFIHRDLVKTTIIEIDVNRS